MDCRNRLQWSRSSVQLFMDGTTPAGQWFCEKAEDIIDELPHHLKSAEMSNKLMFSGESIALYVMLPLYL